MRWYSGIDHVLDIRPWQTTDHTTINRLTLRIGRVGAKPWWRSRFAGAG
jgi:hypothetical protein